jgi:hypothetical protein
MSRSGKRATAEMSRRSPSAAPPASRTRRSKSRASSACSASACAFGVDHTIDMRFPASGSHASTPSSRNHWRAVSPCARSVSKFATSADSP